MLFLGIPVWVGRKIHTRYKAAGKHKRNLAVLGGVTASVSNVLIIYRGNLEVFFFCKQICNDGVDVCTFFIELIMNLT